MIETWIVGVAPGLIDPGPKRLHVPFSRAAAASRVGWLERENMKRLALLASVSASLPLGGCVMAGTHEAAVLSAQARQLVCIDGVEYVAIPIKDSWAFAPHYKPDGTLFTCSDSVPRSR
ncbi:MAG TPA: hypothetical protein VGF77_16895 [Allosphingosinicella sp.]